MPGPWLFLYACAEVSTKAVRQAEVGGPCASLFKAPLLILLSWSRWDAQGHLCLPGFPGLAL